MFNFEKINLTFSLNPFLFAAALILLAGYAFYVYRYTVPAVNVTKKIFLVSLRTLSLLLLLFIIFEPILTLAKKVTLEPVNLVFVDNSRSIRIEDGTDRSGTVKNFLGSLENSTISENSVLSSFGNKVDKIEFDSLEQINFSEGSTNFSEIFSSVEEDQNISSITIISDGVITEGINPVYTAEKMGIPVFTIGVGDTSRRNDAAIRNVLFNEYIYAETPTSIVSTITNEGLANKGADVSLFEGTNLLEQKRISLSEDGVQNVSFSYTPETAGEKKLTIAVSELEGEFTYANNRKVFYINVLSNKIKVLLLAGSPSPDLSFIKKSLEDDNNLSVKSYVQITDDKFTGNANIQHIPDSTDIFFLVGFPSSNTPEKLFETILEELNKKNKPFFIVLSGGTDFNKLNQLKDILPFNFSNASENYTKVQPSINPGQQQNPLLQNNSENPVSAWNNLPPINQPAWNFIVKPESEIVSRIKINNVPLNEPLILTRRLGSKRAIAVLAKDIWKWKLQTAVKDLDLFDRFIHNSVKWLNTSEELKQVTIKTSKKLYPLGEQVEFMAEVYDQAFNPVSDAEVNIHINGDGENYDLTLSSVGSGLYEGTFQTSKAGDYSFTGEALQNNVSLGNDKGSFNIGEVDIEMVIPYMDYNFLSLLANQTGGRFFNPSDYDELFNILQKLNQTKAKEKLNINEVRLWSNEWLMVIIILLLGIEWFVRKQSGML